NHVGIDAARHDAVKQARIGVGDQMLLHRAAGGAVADGKQRPAELLDKVLLDLRDSLGRFHVVVVGAHHIERAGRDRVAARDEVVEEAGAQVLDVELAVGAGHGAEVAAHVIVGLHAAAKTVDQLAVPAGGGRARGGPPALASVPLPPPLSPPPRPPQPPFDSALTAADTSLPPTVTCGAASAAILTRASPPLTSSARDDSTSIASLGFCAAAVPAASAPQMTATDALRRHIVLVNSTSLVPPMFVLLRQN